MVACCGRVGGLCLGLGGCRRSFCGCSFMFGVLGDLYIIGIIYLIV